jgi:hypothetical protein
VTDIMIRSIIGPAYTSVRSQCAAHARGCADVSEVGTRVMKDETMKFMFSATYLLLFGVYQINPAAAACAMSNCNEQTNPGSCQRAQAAYNQCSMDTQAVSDAKYQRQHQTEIDAAKRAGVLQNQMNKILTPPRTGNVGAAR